MILTEAENSASKTIVGLTRAIPPSLAGKAKRSRSASIAGGLPVKAGANFVRMISSSGWRRWLMLGRSG